jgi:hypothetical protein
MFLDDAANKHRMKKAASRKVTLGMPFLGSLCFCAWPPSKKMVPLTHFNAAQGSTPFGHRLRCTDTWRAGHQSRPIGRPRPGSEPRMSLGQQPNGEKTGEQSREEAGENPGKKDKTQPQLYPRRLTGALGGDSDSSQKLVAARGKTRLD